MNQQVLMWFSGLRGAVAFALGVTFLDHPDFSPAIKGLIFGTTVMVVTGTVIILGGLTPYMLVWLKITNSEKISSSSDHGNEPPEDENYIVTEKDLEQPLFGWLYRIDVK
jgi:sodium/hydrogen exchanger 8